MPSDKQHNCTRLEKKKFQLENGSKMRRFYFIFSEKTLQLMLLILVFLLLTLVKEEKLLGQRLEEFTETFNAFQMLN